MDAGTATRLSTSFDKDMFMKLLLAQLRNQNPEQPMSNAELTSQISSLAMVEGMNKLNAGFGEMMKLQRLAGAADIIGREIVYDDSRGARQTGTVESVKTVGEKLKLVVSGAGAGSASEVPLDNVRRVL